ncbi:MAG TPA: Ig-like domain repeat protein [Acidimicrobiales bacterium]|nr:Ig-like domain repeat protein [Acidimicrobiales bacterium]
MRDRAHDRRIWPITVLGATLLVAVLDLLVPLPGAVASAIGPSARPSAAKPHIVQHALPTPTNVPVPGASRPLASATPSWQPVGPDAVYGSSNGSVGVLGIDWNNLQVFYAAGGTQVFNDSTGIYVTSNGGASWQQADNGLGSPYISDIWVSQSDAAVAAAATTTGVFYTTDEGATWSASNLTRWTYNIVQIASTLYAVTSNGVWNSTNNGATWVSTWATTGTQSLSTLGANSAEACAFGSSGGATPSALLVCGSPTVSWAAQTPSFSITGAAYKRLTIGPAPTSPIYVNLGGTLEVGTNGGTTWSALPTPSFVSGSYNRQWQAFTPDAVDPSLLYATSGDEPVYESTDGGSTWTNPTNDCDTRTIRADPATSNDLMVGADLCLVLTTTGYNGSWLSVASNMTNYMTYSLAASGLELLTIDQDNSPIVSMDGGATWTYGPYGSEFGFAYINPVDPSDQYINSSPPTSYAMSSDGGNSWASLTYLPYGIDGVPGAPSRLDGYDQSTCALSESSNSGTTWSDTATSLKTANGGTCPVTGVSPEMTAVDPSDTSHVLVATGSGTVWSTADNGSTWSKITLPAGHSASVVAFDQADPNYVLAGGTYSTDGGTTFSNDSSLCGGGCPARAVAFIPGGAVGDAVIATFGGPYFFSPSASTWQSDLGNAVSPEDEAVAITNGSVYLGTYGEGVIQTPVSAIDPNVHEPSVTGVSPSTGSSVGGQNVTISGTGFTGATSVQFGSTPAPSLSVTSDSKINAVVPAGQAGATVDVTVVGVGGPSPIVPSDQYSYLPVSAATSTVVAVPPLVEANGAASSTVTVTLEDQAGNPVAGKTVALNASGGFHSVVTCTAAPCQTDSAGQVQFVATDLTGETVTYSATDVTDGLFVTQSATVIFTRPAITTTSLPGGVLGSAYSATLAAVGGTAPDTWSITSGALFPGLSLNPSTGQISGTPTATGTRSLTFQVADALGTNAAATLALTVRYPTTTTLTAAPSSTVFGTPVTFTVHVTSATGTPTGSVPVELGTTTVCSATLAGGTGSCTAAPPAAGALTLTAQYPGDATHATSSGSAALTVALAGTTTSASVTPTAVTGGTAASYQAQVTSSAGTPSGTVSFAVGPRHLCLATLSAGHASCASSAAPVGSDLVTASYSGDATHAASTGTASLTVTAPPPGYWLVGGDGGIFTFGSGQFHGSTGSLHLQRPVVGIVATSDHGGYWLNATDGGIFAFGDAAYYGSLPGLGFNPAGSGLPRSLEAPIVGMVPSADGGGYFMVARDGGVFAFGDATFEGSCYTVGGCAGAAVAVVPDTSGQGYWLVTATGHVYAFGDAPGLVGVVNPAAPVTSAVVDPAGGLWVLLADGSVVALGGAPSLGNASGMGTATAIFASADGGGYWVAGAEGAVDGFGDATFEGSMSGRALNAPIIAGSGW